MRLLIHGGAGDLHARQMSQARRDKYTSTLNHCLQAGAQQLSEGKSALDVAAAAVAFLEDSELFNAGRGGVLNEQGKCLADASIMNGPDRSAGAVAATGIIKNPIYAALTVLQKSPHVLLVAEGAHEFARQHGIELVDEEYFITDHRVEQLNRSREKVSLDHDTMGTMGTVGAVALDQDGRLAAATSTGGMVNKAHGRVGDSALIGAGTFADENIAVSCTGEGEFFIQVSAASLLAYEWQHHKGLKVAARRVLNEVKNAGGRGGLIAIDKSGNYCLPFTTRAMFRGYLNADLQPVAAIT